MGKVVLRIMLKPNSLKLLYTLDINSNILKPSSNRSPYTFTVVQKVKHRVYTIHVFLNKAILCQDSASYFI